MFVLSIATVSAAINDKGTVRISDVKTVVHSAKAAATDKGTMQTSNVQATQTEDGHLNVTMQLTLEQLRLAANHQIFLTPYVESADGKQSVQMPSVVLSGRNMHYVYLRSGRTKATGKTTYTVAEEAYVKPGHSATIAYSELTAILPWMLADGAVIRVATDTCGCGRPLGSTEQATPLDLNPASRMMIMPYPRPSVVDEKIIAHNGRARVQFEVDRTELHESPYRCKNGQHIDNRAQLKVIDDSVRHALETPNVEIKSIHICGFASPESPYLHNEELANGRSRSLAEYVARKYSIPAENSTYSSVPENWTEFRELVAAASDITEQQRQELMTLIDAPAYAPSDYDRKEQVLKTDRRFAQLYRSKILPVWFPQLRCSQFTINTHLKPMTDLQLRDIIKTQPELMSLNQIYRVANTYEHGSQEWKETMAVALRYYADDEVANANAAAQAIEDHDYDAAEQYLLKAGTSDDANIMRGIIATHKGKYAEAREWFEKAKAQSQAEYNMGLIK